MSIEISNAWLEPVDDAGCGPDLEYEPAFMELAQAAAGKPETQFGPAEPPAWPLVLEQAETLFGQTRDLRIALYWARAAINTAGLEGLAPGLQLLHGLLDRFWDQLHPQPDPDDGDAFARVSVLASLNATDGLLGDVRQSPLIRDRRLGGVRMRDVEVAVGKLEPRAGETPYSATQLSGMLGDQRELLERVRSAHAAASEALNQLRRLMDDRFGTNTIEVKTLGQMLGSLKSVIPEPVADAPAEEGDGSSAGDDAGTSAASAPVRRSGGGIGAIESRQDAVRAINMICAYLDRAEPSNPAQLLLRRAERMIDKNFIQLVRDLAPDAVAEVARILGVSPDAFSEGEDS